MVWVFEVWVLVELGFWRRRGWLGHGRVVPEWWGSGRWYGSGLVGRLPAVDEATNIDRGGGRCHEHFYHST